MGTLSVPTLGKKGNTEHPKVNAAIEALNAVFGSENKIKGSGVEAGAIADTNLASPNNSAYRLVFVSTQTLRNSVNAGTYLLASAEGNGVVSGTGISSLTVDGFYFDDADYTVANKTQKLRLRAQILTNATKPALKFTVGLYPVTVAGGAAEIKLTLGTVVSGSTVEFNEPAASTATSGVTSDFAIPSDGFYMFGVVTSATLTLNAQVLLAAQLQTRSV